MSGHSKWANIKRKKEATDSAKAKIFTKIGREMAVVVKEGGPDPANNAKLRDLIAKAKANNVPNDNIDRIIKKAAGDGEKNNYEDMVYEGYGPSGVAVIVECLTDNKNRTAGDIRHYFDKFGGNLGTSGCVSFMFSDKGTVILENTGADEDKVMEDCMEAGADDFSVEDDVIEVSCDPNSVGAVREALEGLGYNVLSAEAEKVPSTYTNLDDEEAIRKMGLLLEHLEDNDDVQNVFHNWGNMPEDEEED
ncbi:MAG: YebC/PmpR family DNA-binding transcriptional regulator [Ruminococcus sp.]|nr:YebC/PmpR family DNA-binding transcriptional regulator [Ruminococcus sp.]